MSTQSFRSLLAILLFLTVPAMAHDPSEHMRAAENPDCTTMDGSSHEGMDSNDPIVQAMMKKCMSAMHKEATSIEAEATESPALGERMTEEGHSHDHPES